MHAGQSPRAPPRRGAAGGALCGLLSATPPLAFKGCAGEEEARSGRERGRSPLCPGGAAKGSSPPGIGGDDDGETPPSLEMCFGAGWGLDGARGRLILSQFFSVFGLRRVGVGVGVEETPVSCPLACPGMPGAHPSCQLSKSWVRVLAAPCQSWGGGGTRPLPWKAAAGWRRGEFSMQEAAGPSPVKDLAQLGQEWSWKLLQAGQRAKTQGPDLV